MTYYRYMAAAHRLQAQAYRAYALAASVDHHLTEAGRRDKVDHFAQASAEYDKLADSYTTMETAA